MSDTPPDPELSPEELALFEWLDVAAGMPGEIQPPAELLSRCERLPHLMQLVRQLQGFGPVPAAEPSDNGSSQNGNLLPRPFGPYDLEQQLGRGGMGVVYLARHRALGSLVALKMIRTSEFASEEEIRRFHLEGRAASRLQHPHVVQVHDAGEVNGTPYLVMQYVEGESLAQRLKKRRPTIEQSLKWLIPIAQAVSALHRHQIVHRDLKPGNILLDRTDTPFVTDFGLVKLFELDSERTASGALLGTPAYMSPEQAWGKQQDIGPASDIYSFGAVFYELLTGNPPFREDSPLDQILRLRDSDPLPPRRHNPAIPMELQQICMRCLEKKPRDRYSTAGEIAEDLDRYRRGEPIALRPIGIMNSLRRWMRREPPLVSHLSGFVTMAIIIQVAEWLAPGHRAPYLPVMTVLLIWTILCVILQRLLLRGYGWVKLLWVPVDTILFTIAVAYAEGPSGSLMVGYSLMIVASAMWYEEVPVILMTIASVIAYVTLLTLHWETQPVHYPFIVAGILAVVGGVLTTLVRRIRKLLQLQAEQ